jgi:hypothetical protein
MEHFKGIETVNIDDNGRFKYILIKLESNKEEKFVIRGALSADYHGLNMLIYILSNIKKYLKIYINICLKFLS